LHSTNRQRLYPVKRVVVDFESVLTALRAGNE